VLTTSVPEKARKNKVEELVDWPFLLKVAHINYVSRNQLHCTANLNFGFMDKKAKHCWALSTNFLFLFS
jgi:hypothetical protein